MASELCEVADVSSAGIFQGVSSSAQPMNLGLNVDLKGVPTGWMLTGFTHIDEPGRYFLWPEVRARLGS